MNTIKTLFVLDKAKSNSKGLAPLGCRITYLGERKPFATGLFINPKYWDSKSQKTKPPNEENNFINTELSLIKNKINQAFLLFQVQENIFNAEDIYRIYKGKKPVKETGTIECYNEFLTEYAKLIDIEI